MRSRGLLLLSCVVLALALGLAAASPASAQPRGHCTASTCNGRDPDQTGCSTDTADNPTWTSPGVMLRGGTMYLWLRYSPLCASNWARVTMTSGGYKSLFVRNTYGNYAYYSGQCCTAGPYSSWSAMVDGTVPAQACVVLTDDNSTACTAWY